MPRFDLWPADPDSGGAVSAAAGAAECNGLHQPRGQPASPDRHRGRHQRRHRKTTGLPALLTPRPPELLWGLSGLLWGGWRGRSLRNEHNPSPHEKKREKNKQNLQQQPHSPRIDWIPITSHLLSVFSFLSFFLPLFFFFLSPLWLICENNRNWGFSKT